MKRALILGISCLLAAAALAQPEPTVQALSQLDRRFMKEQRTSVDNLARSRLGRQITGQRDNDLAVLQALLDRGHVRAEQTAELQAMGIVLGDLLAQDPAASWVVYRDQVGRSRALKMGDSDEFLFPVTMISRRVEAGARVDVEAIYQRADRILQPYRRPLPFQ